MIRMLMVFSSCQPEVYGISVVGIANAGEKVDILFIFAPA